MKMMTMTMMSMMRDESHRSPEANCIPHVDAFGVDTTKKYKKGRGSVLVVVVSLETDHAHAAVIRLLLLLLSSQTRWWGTDM